jgi:Rrf2 family protein
LTFAHNLYDFCHYLIYRFSGMFSELIPAQLKGDTMFRISRRLDYGLHLMVALAADKSNQPQSTASLAESLQMPLPFMHQIAHALMQAGLIKATPGPRGGLRLNQPASEITALQIVESLEGPITLNPSTDSGSCCDRQENCATQMLWGDIQHKLVLLLASNSLEALASTPQMSELPVYTLESNP